MLVDTKCLYSPLDCAIWHVTSQNVICKFVILNSQIPRVCICTLWLSVISQTLVITQQEVRVHQRHHHIYKRCAAHAAAPPTRNVIEEVPEQLYAGARVHLLDLHNLWTYEIHNLWIHTVAQCCCRNIYTEVHTHTVTHIYAHNLTHTSTQRFTYTNTHTWAHTHKTHSAPYSGHQRGCAE